MKGEEPVQGIEEKIGHAMVKSRLITDIQLKTAQDYQRSLGGTLPEVVARLGFVRPQVLHRFLSDANLLMPPGPRPQGKAAAHEVPPGKVPLERFQRGARAGAGASDESSPAPGGGPRRDVDPLLDALIRLLVQKGIIGLEEQEQLLHSGSRTLLV